MSDETIRKNLASVEFAAFFHSEEREPTKFAVAYLSAKDRELFNCEGDTIWLSRRSLDEHKTRHPEVTIDDYRTIPDIVSNAQIWHGHGTKRYLLLWIGDKPYRAAIKTDAPGMDVWFLSLVISGKQKPPKGAVRVR